jgi:hypothetical protein
LYAARSGDAGRSLPLALALLMWPPASLAPPVLPASLTAPEDDANVMYWRPRALEEARSAKEVRPPPAKDPPLPAKDASDACCRWWGWW